MPWAANRRSSSSQHNYQHMNQSSSSSSPAAAPAGAGGNPVSASYAAWAQKTPLLTRALALSLALLYLLSFLVDLEAWLSNEARYSLFRAELYRLLLSPLVGNSLLTLLLGLFMFVPSASKFETSIGSAAFAALLATLTIGANVLFLLSCLILYYAAGIDALGWRSQDVWLWVFALMSIECFRDPEVPRRILCIPMDIPAKYMPLIFYLLLILFNGVEMGYGYSILMGYLACKGHLDRFRPSSYFLVSQESSEGWLHRASRQEGYVLAGTMGHDSWIPVNQVEGEDRELGFPASSTHSESSQPREQFPGSGHKLTDDSSSHGGGFFPAPGVTTSPFYGGGTIAAPPTNMPSREEIAARRLAALGANKL